MRFVDEEMELSIVNFFTFPEEVAEATFSPDSSMLAILLPKKNSVLIESVEYACCNSAANAKARSKTRLQWSQ